MQETYSHTIKIPKDRVAVLIGKKGEIKKQIETTSETKITVDSGEGDVIISGKDAIKLYAAREIVHAIARGFNPEIALLLMKHDYGFELINIMDYAKTKNDMIRLKGRIIGEDGKSRKTIEELTNTDICVYGKSIGIIGELEYMPIARKAVETLLRGSPHNNVYRWLEKRRKELKKRHYTDGKRTDSS